MKKIIAILNILFFLFFFAWIILAIRLTIMVGFWIAPIALFFPISGLWALGRGRLKGKYGIIHRKKSPDLFFAFMWAFGIISVIPMIIIITSPSHEIISSQGFFIVIAAMTPPFISLTKQWYEMFKWSMK